MSDAPTPAPRVNWCDQFAFTRCFRAFGMSYNWNQLLLAFAAVVLTYVGGRLLDTMSPKSTQVLVVRTTQSYTSELDAFLKADSKPHRAMKEWIEQNEPRPNSQREGVFATLLLHCRATANLAINKVLDLNIRQFFEVILNGFKAWAWLLVHHGWFAVIFGLYSLIVWSLFGGAAARVAALRATRDERISMGAALAFSKAKFLSFLMGPLMPIIAIAVAGFALFLGGLIGAIPWAGELIVGILFFLALIGGFVISFIVVGLIAGGPLMFPTVAVEGSDAFDVMSRTFAYIYQRPWKTALYMFVSAIYGAICLVFVKLFVRIMLVAIHLFVGFSMNWGSPFMQHKADHNPVHNKADHDIGKLNAIWSAPSIDGHIPMVGSFNDGPKLTNATLFAQWMIQCWVYLVWALFVALAVSMFLSSSTIIYLLLRREVDLTDLEEVYLEESGEEPLAAAPPPPPPKTGGTSLPVIGSS